jgi:hypothetical protein
MVNEYFVLLMNRYFQVMVGNLLLCDFVLFANSKFYFELFTKIVFYQKGEWNDTGMVHAWVDQKVMPINLIVRQNQPLKVKKSTQIAQMT